MAIRRDPLYAFYYGVGRDIFLSIHHILLLSFCLHTLTKTYTIFTSPQPQSAPRCSLKPGVAILFSFCLHNLTKAYIIYTPRLQSAPPLLFEVRSGSELGVSFGGSPTIYLHNPSPKDNSVFFLRSLQSGKLVSAYRYRYLTCINRVVPYLFDLKRPSKYATPSIFSNFLTSKSSDYCVDNYFFMPRPK